MNKHIHILFLIFLEFLMQRQKKTSQQKQKNLNNWKVSSLDHYLSEGPSELTAINQSSGCHQLCVRWCLCVHIQKKWKIIFISFKFGIIMLEVVTDYVTDKVPC